MTLGLATGPGQRPAGGAFSWFAAVTTLACTTVASWTAVAAATAAVVGVTRAVSAAIWAGPILAASASVVAVASARAAVAANTRLIQQYQRSKGRAGDCEQP